MGGPRGKSFQRERQKAEAAQGPEFKDSAPPVCVAVMASLVHKRAKTSSGEKKLVLAEAAHSLLLW